MLSADLRQVGCEACHGPGHGHTLDPAGQRLATRPAASVCQRCHSKEKDGHQLRDRYQGDQYPRLGLQSLLC
jgi:cytochrome c553